MAIRFACPSCKTTYTVDDREAGTKTQCKTCGQRVQVPAPPRLKTVLGEVLDAPGDLPAASKPSPATQPQPEPFEFHPPPQSRPPYFKWRTEKLSMFVTEESARIRTALPRKQLEEAIERALGRLGRVSFYKRGALEIAGSRFRSFAADVRIDGALSEGREEDEWTFRLSYDVRPSGACWAIAIVGFIFILIGPLIFLMPYSTKGEVQRAVDNAMRDLRDEIENAPTPNR